MSGPQSAPEEPLEGGGRPPLPAGRGTPPAYSDEDLVPRCEDCGGSHDTCGDLLLVSANYGQGAFFAVLCPVCDHRRQYRGELLARRRRRADSERVIADELAWGYVPK